MASAQTPPPPSTQAQSTTEEATILTTIRTTIDTNMASSIDRASAEYLRPALQAYKDAIDELEVWSVQIQCKIEGVEMQLPTVVHEYDEERRAKLEERLWVLTQERDELWAVRVSLVGDYEEVERRLGALSN